jgi:unspecific monooxygenase
MVLTREQVGARQGAREQFNRFFAEHAALRRKRPTGDFMSDLVAVNDGGAGLTETELVTTCTLIMSAGYALTVHLIGNGMLALMRNPPSATGCAHTPSRSPARWRSSCATTRRPRCSRASCCPTPTSRASP